MAVASMHLGVWSWSKPQDLLNSERWFNKFWAWHGCWCLSISPSAQLLGFTHTTISRVYKEWCEKGKTSNKQQSCGPKCLVESRGQRRMCWLIQADRRATLNEITTRYNRGMQQSICEATTHPTLRQMGYNSRRPHQVPLITTNRKKRLQFTRAHQNWTVEDGSDESRFLLRHSDGKVRIWTW